MNLKKRVERAEKLTELAWSRYKQEKKEKNIAVAESKAAKFWISALMGKLGDEIVITKKELEAQCNIDIQVMEDGNYKITKRNSHPHTHAHARE